LYPISYFFLCAFLCFIDLAYLFSNAFIQVASVANYSHQQQQQSASAQPNATLTTVTKTRRSVRERGNTAAAEISLHFRRLSSPEKPPQPSRGAAATGRQRVTVVGALPTFVRPRPLRTSTVDERHPAALTATTTRKLGKQCSTSHVSMTPVG